MKNYGLSAKGAPRDVKLSKLQVLGNICGEYIEYTLQQEYRNRTQENLEGIYTFPAPATALLTGIEVELGGRNLQAIIEDRDQVVSMLTTSKEQGINTLALEQEEEGFFTIRIGNILPNEKVIIRIRYMDQLTYEDDTLTLLMPSVMAPRYAQEAVEEEEEDLEVYLSLLVESYSRLEFKSPSHRIKVEREDDNLSKITLTKGQTLDQDFILMLKEVHPLVAAGMGYTYYEEEEEKSILMLRLLPTLPDIEVEYTTNYSFILDISLSMEGYKLEEAKNALLIALRSLEEGDKFNILAFHSTVAKFSGNGKVKFSKENLAAATEWIEGLSTREGECLFDAVKESLREAELEREESTIFLFTDEYVENEDEVLEYVRTHVEENRIFPMAMDTEVNSYFINKLAEVGGGRPEFIDKGERIDNIILRQFNRIHNSQLDVTEIHWGDMEVERTYPGTITYLYDREPFTIFAKVNGEISGRIRIQGVVDDVDYTMEIDLDKLEIEDNLKLIDKVWARKRIESLMEKRRMLRGSDAERIAEEILRISKEYSILSSETSFLMLESLMDPVSGMSFNKIVPVEMTERTMKNLAKGYFLDETAYSFDASIREKMATTGLSHKEAIQAVRFDRDNLLRLLAKNQQADGSFLDLGEEDPEIIVETTFRALLAFLLGNETTGIYQNNVSKAIRAAMGTLSKDPKLLTERNYLLIRTAYELAEKKNLVRKRAVEAFEELTLKVSDMKYRESLEEVAAMVTAASTVQKKFIVAATLNVSKSDGEEAETIFERDIKSNITFIANIAMAKAL